MDGVSERFDTVDGMDMLTTFFAIAFISIDQRQRGVYEA